MGEQWDRELSKLTMEACGEREGNLHSGAGTAVAKGMDMSRKWTRQVWWMEQIWRERERKVNSWASVGAAGRTRSRLPRRQLEDGVGWGAPRVLLGGGGVGRPLWAGGEVGGRQDAWVWALGSLLAGHQHGWEALSGTLSLVLWGGRPSLCGQGDRGALPSMQAE